MVKLWAFSKVAETVKRLVRPKALISYSKDEVSSRFSEYAAAENWEQIYIDSSEVRMAVDLTAELVALAPLQIIWNYPPNYPTGDKTFSFKQTEQLFLQSLEDLGGEDFISFIAKHMIVDGVYAAEIVSNAAGLPVECIKMRPRGVVPLISEDFKFTGVNYRTLMGGEIPLDVDEILYIPRSPFGRMWRGQSGLDSLQKTLDELDSINHDLAMICHRMWKKSFIFTVDDSAMTDDESTDLMSRLLGMEAGQSIAFNKSVETKQIELEADISKLIEARQDKRSQISEHFGFPRVMWSSSKSSDMGTMRPALSLFYDMRVKPLQRAIARELTKKVLRPYAKKYTLAMPTLKFATMSLEDF
jgi:hypothetical protein